MSDIERIIKKPLSDADLKHILGDDLKIVKYRDLSKEASLESLLPKATDYCIILIEEEQDSGHWVALMRYDNTVEFFDPVARSGTQSLPGYPRRRENSCEKPRSTSQDY